MSQAEDNQPHLISQVEYARRRGWSKQYVGQLVAKGRIRLVNGLVDPAAADQALAATYDPGRAATFRSGGPPAQAASPVAAMPTETAAFQQGPFAKARTVREHFRALREKLEYEAATGSLIPKARAEEAVFEAGRLVRDELYATAGPIAEQLVQLCPALPKDQAEEIVRAHITAALIRVADILENRGHAINTTAAAQP